MTKKQLRKFADDVSDKIGGRHSVNGTGIGLRGGEEVFVVYLENSITDDQKKELFQGIDTTGVKVVWEVIGKIVAE